MESVSLKMQTHLRIRLADRHEIEWINKCYDEVDFVHSDFDKEVIVIAENDLAKTGIGRLIKLGLRDFELGGMYVFEPFRGQGIAGKIIEALIRHVPHQGRVFCIAFLHLQAFYERYGFQLCSDYRSVPEVILKKLSWCKGKYLSSTVLLVLKK